MDNLAHQGALYSVGLDNDKSAFFFRVWHGRYCSKNPHFTQMQLLLSFPCGVDDSEYCNLVALFV
jgi:hypothetical protein